MDITHIVAVSMGTFGIGFENKLPWSVSSDLKHFKNTTLNGAVLMGRKTYESLPFSEGLPNRMNFVLTRDTGFDCPGAYNVQSVQEAIDICNCELVKDKFQELFIIGGAEVYMSTLDIVTKKLITVISGKHKCDTFLTGEYWEDEDFTIKHKEKLCDRAELITFDKE